MDDRRAGNRVRGVAQVDSDDGIVHGILAQLMQVNQNLMTLIYVVAQGNRGNQAPPPVEEKEDDPQPPTFPQQGDMRVMNDGCYQYIRQALPGNCWLRAKIDQRTGEVVTLELEDPMGGRHKTTEQEVLTRFGGIPLTIVQRRADGALNEDANRG